LTADWRKRYADLMRYRLRTLLIVITLIATVTGALCWWTRPYVVVNDHYPNGQVFQEEWRRRNLTGGVERLSMATYYPDGRKAQDARRGLGVRFWLHDGSEVNANEWTSDTNRAWTEVSPDKNHLDMRDSSSP